MSVASFTKHSFGDRLRWGGGGGSHARTCFFPVLYDFPVCGSHGECANDFTLHDVYMFLNVDLH